MRLLLMEQSITLYIKKEPPFMFVVENQSTPRYISGIFSDREKAEKYLYENSKFNVVLRRPSAKFPFYIIEEAGPGRNCFRYVNLTQALRVINNIVRINDPEHTYLNIYMICEEFHSKKAGADEMGSLPHIHITNKWLTLYDKCGDCLIAEMS